MNPDSPDQAYHKGLLEGYDRGLSERVCNSSTFFVVMLGGTVGFGSGFFINRILTLIFGV